MGGIYVHIPFCRKACVYCDFHFSTNLSRKAELVQSLEEEIHIRSEEILELDVLRTLYLGGGTPSVLDSTEIQGLFDAIQTFIPFHPAIEITLEANPDDLDEAYLKELYHIGVNRLSIGIQSFSEEILSWMNRSHTAIQSKTVIDQVRKAGFDNFSTDLIFGNPGSDRNLWKNDLETLLAFKPPHISVYALTVEAKTALAHQVAKDKLKLPEDEAYQAQFMDAHERLTEAGYEHYELSNYALPGFRSQHNSAYWEGVPYVGLGPSAHSYDGKQRSWNLANNAKYIQRLREKKSPVEEKETLSLRDQYHEYLMTHLRKETGIDIKKIEDNWVKDWETRFQEQVSTLKAQELMVQKDHFLSLSPQGWLLSDQIIRDLFIDQDL